MNNTISERRVNPPAVSRVTPVNETSQPAPIFPELILWRGQELDWQLGYFGKHRFVIVAYNPEFLEVLWKDCSGHGFGGGGWRIFLEELAPLAGRSGADLGASDRLGTHVLLLDRFRRRLYVAPRLCADEFLAAAAGHPPPVRRCLCAITGGRPGKGCRGPCPKLS